MNKLFPVLLGLTVAIIMLSIISCGEYVTLSDFFEQVEGTGRVSCNDNYTYVNETNSCNANTQATECTDLPEYARWNNVNSITQTWNVNNWEPASTGSYNVNASTEYCNYNCNFGYSSNGNFCVKSGSLDLTFNEVGYVAHYETAGGNHQFGYGIAIDSNGKYIVAGGQAPLPGDGDTYDMAVWRYNSDGTLDTGFGDNGIVVKNNVAGGDGADDARAIVAEADGKILVTGYSDRLPGSGSDNRNADMIIWKFNSDGTLDADFGNSGIVIHDNAAGGSGGDVGNDILLNSDGKVLVAGMSKGLDGDHSIIWRYNADGTLDNGFGGNGFVKNNNAGGGKSDEFTSMVDSSGKILVVGKAWSDNGSDLLIRQFNSDGTPDTSFGDNGVVLNNNAAGGNDDDRANSVTIADGKIFITGFSDNSASDRDMVIWSYNSDGTTNTDFGTSGIVVSKNVAGVDQNEEGKAIAVDSSGRIIVAGLSNNNTDDDMVVWRYNSDGTPDTGFGTDGIVVRDADAGLKHVDAGWSMVMDDMGRIIVTGYSVSSEATGAMIIWRINP